MLERLAVVALMAVLAAPGSAPADEPTCDWVVGCGEDGSGEIGDGGVEIGVGDERDETDPGDPEQPGQPGQPDPGLPADPDPGPGSGDGGGWDADGDGYSPCAGGDDFTGVCPDPLPPEDPDDDERTTITIADVAFFPVDAGAARMEPDGWAVEGLPANFYAAAPVQVKVGQVLDRRTEVRFTPYAYRWVYGDGAEATLASPGTSWADLGQREFSPTPTSHTYQRAGDYIARLEVVFTAEWRRLRPQWTPISGTLSIPAEPLRLTVADADTVLVQRDCVADPTGPGC